MALQIIGRLSPPKSSKGFGSSALWIGAKMFAFLSTTDELVMRLPKGRMDGLVSTGHQDRCELKKGRPMREQMALSLASGVDWLDLASESGEFVRSSQVAR